jgi:hypothetical protein
MYSQPIYPRRHILVEQLHLLQSISPEEVHTAHSYLCRESLQIFGSSQEQDTRPPCVILPSTSVDVSLAVRALTGFGDLSLRDFQFVIRGAG